MIKTFYLLSMLLSILFSSLIIQDIYAENDYSEMTDEELIDKFQEILNVKTRDDFFTLFPNTETEYLNIELTKTLLQIEDNLNQRGWKLLPFAAIHENGSKIYFQNISEPREIHGKVFRSIDVELLSFKVDDLVDEYDALIKKFDNLGTNSEHLEINQKLIDEINSDLYRFENVVILLQNHGYDGLAEVEHIDGKFVGTVSFFDKYTLEPLFKRQIPQGTINLFGTMGLFREFATGGAPLSYEEQVIMLNSSSALIGMISTFSDDSDPNNEISSGMILAALGAYHPTVDNLKTSELELLSSKEIPSLKMQEKSGVAPLDFVCKGGLQKIFKSSDKSPACVKPKTAEKLIDRGWANTW